MLALFTIILAASAPDSTEAAHALAKKVVQSYANPHHRSGEPSLWRIEWADANGDDMPDAFAYALSAGWCDGGSCTLLVLEAIPEGDQEELGPFLVVAEVRGVRGPVVVTESARRSWQDLVVIDANGTRRRLAFDGETYPPRSTLGDPCGPEAGTVLFGAD